jgi:predicted phage tail protein
VSRGGVRAAREQAKRASDLIPLPRRPYRDSALFYAILGALLILVVWVTGGGVVTAAIVAAGFFVVATAFSWWRFRIKLAERAREAAERR